MKTNVGGRTLLSPSSTGRKGRFRTAETSQTRVHVTHMIITRLPMCLQGLVLPWWHTHTTHELNTMPATCCHGWEMREKMGHFLSSSLRSLYNSCVASCWLMEIMRQCSGFTCSTSFPVWVNILQTWHSWHQVETINAQLYLLVCWVLFVFGHSK